MRNDRGIARMLNLETRRAPYEICYLIKEVQTLKGEIVRLEKALVENPAKIAERQAMLKAMQLVLDRHPVEVQVAKIPAVRRNTKSLLPHGQVTQFIFRTFRENGGKEL